MPRVDKQKVMGSVPVKKEVGADDGEEQDVNGCCSHSCTPGVMESFKFQDRRREEKRKDGKERGEKMEQGEEEVITGRVSYLPLNFLRWNDPENLHGGN